MRILPLILLIGALFAAPVTADANDHFDRLVIAQDGCKNLQQAVEQVRRRTNGQIVSAETRMKGNREEHRIKVLTKDGKVKTHKVPGCRRKKD